LYYLECIGCHTRYEPEDIIYTCEHCGDLLDIKYNYENVDYQFISEWKKRPLSVWRYKELLPVLDEAKKISLNEGGTRLHRCTRLAKEFGLEKLYIKTEGDNPTASFKDRGMTVGVTKAVEYKVKAVICASTGNTSASLSAYAAKAGIKCLVIIPAKKIAYGKLAQAMIHGAKLIQVRGSFDDALKIVLELSSNKNRFYLLNSINPYRIEGQKTLAYEIIDQLGGKAPDKVVMPVGNAGNITAAWKGFKEFKELSFVDSAPKMMGVQAEGAAPVAKAFLQNKKVIEPVPNPETLATAIRIGSPVSWKRALGAIRESGGTAEIVTDGEIVDAQKLLARYEGLFVEPASASSVAGLKKLIESGQITKEDTVVCIATGHGLKDPDVPVQFCEKASEIEPTLEAVEKLVGDQL
jgi:threonine synthase